MCQFIDWIVSWVIILPVFRQDGGTDEDITDIETETTLKEAGDNSTLESKTGTLTNGSVEVSNESS